jgi:hypothetical protein
MKEEVMIRINRKLAFIYTVGLAAVLLICSTIMWKSEFPRIPIRMKDDSTASSISATNLSSKIGNDLEDDDLTTEEPSSSLLKWQLVSPGMTDDEVYVYSAFFDPNFE